MENKFLKLIERLNGLTDSQVVELFKSEPELAEQYAELEKLIFLSLDNFGTNEVIELEREDETK